MDALRGIRAQEQPANLLPPPGLSRAHEAAENHRDDIAPAVTSLDPDGEAARAGIRKGDRLLAVDGEPVRDVLEFSYLTAGEPATLTMERDGASYEVTLEGFGPTGIEFERELFDGLRRCDNSCVFCFVHQLPAKVVRRSLLAKDEDYRLSFLHGGYVTMGNFTEEDYARIFEMRLSPLYVSVHATDLEVRRRMLGNPEAPDILEGLARLQANDIEFHGQIVLVPGHNTGDELRRTLDDLAAFPNMRSTAVVPVGLTRYRERLPQLRELTSQEAGEALALIDEARAKETGLRFFAADELFAAAGKPIPEASYYDPGYALREDGVGMIRSFEDGFRRLTAMPLPGPTEPQRLALPTGTAAAPHFERFLLPGLNRIPNLTVELIPVENHFFGTGITVSGLLTGEDIVAAVKARGRFDRVLINEHAFQPGGEIMLDGSTREDLEKALGAEVLRVQDDPAALLTAVGAWPERAAACGGAMEV